MHVNLNELVEFDRILLFPNFQVTTGSILRNEHEMTFHLNRGQHGMGSFQKGKAEKTPKIPVGLNINLDWAFCQPQNTGGGAKSPLITWLFQVR